MPTPARGKLVILLILTVAVSLGTYSWWHQYQAGRRSAEFWGPETAVLVRYGKEVWYVPLQEMDSATTLSGETIAIQGKRFLAGEPFDVAKGRGIVHVRHALVDDLSFDWGAEQTTEAQWMYLLRFQGPGQNVTAAFAPDSGTVRFLEKDRQLTFVPKIADAFRQKYNEWRSQVRGER